MPEIATSVNDGHRGETGMEDWRRLVEDVLSLDAQASENRL
jgi:hypothetical protein